MNDAHAGDTVQSADETATTAAGEPRWIFYVDETMYTPQGYIPAKVTENEPGFVPFSGNGEFASPWYWGKDIETAKRLCREGNAKLGISPDEAMEILSSSLAASR